MTTSCGSIYIVNQFMIFQLSPNIELPDCYTNNSFIIRHGCICFDFHKFWNLVSRVYHKVFIYYFRDSRGSLQPKHCYFRLHINDDCLSILDVWMNLNIIKSMCVCVYIYVYTHTHEMAVFKEKLVVPLIRQEGKGWLPV